MDAVPHVAQVPQLLVRLSSLNEPLWCFAWCAPVPPSLAEGLALSFSSLPAANRSVMIKTSGIKAINGYHTWCMLQDQSVAERQTP